MGGWRRAVLALAFVVAASAARPTCARTAGGDAGALAALKAQAAAAEAQIKAGPTLKDPAGLSRAEEALGRRLLALGDGADGGAALRVAAMVSSRTGDTTRAKPLAAEAYDVCRRAGNAKCAAAALVVSGIVARRQGDLPTALDRYREAAAMYVQLGDPDSAGKTRLNAANVQDDFGDPVGALATYRELSAAYPPSILKYVALRNAANPLMDMGRYAEARSTAAAALALARDPRVKFGALLNPVCAAVDVLGRAEGHLGDASMLPELRRCLQEAQASGVKSDVHFAAQALAETLVALGQAAQAVPAADLAVRTGDVKDTRDLAACLRLCALAHAAAGDRAVALGFADRAYATERTFEQSKDARLVAGALAATALSEREALLQVTRSQAAVRAAEDARRIARLQLSAAAGVAAVLLVAGAFVAWYRLRRLRLRDAELMAERSRVARDLHDTLLQGLTGVTLQLKGASRMAQTEGATALSAQLSGLAQTAGASLVEARNAVWRLRAPFTDDDDLAKVVGAWLQEARASTSAVLRLNAPAALPRLKPTVAEAMFRVVQESVVNALRHGDPREVVVSLAAERRCLTAVIRDDGRGFNVDASRAGSGGHWGLLGARERIERLNGQLDVRSRPGDGASVEARLPL